MGMLDRLPEEVVASFSSLQSAEDRQKAIASLGAHATEPGAYEIVLHAATFDQSPQVRGEALYQLSLSKSALQETAVLAISAGIVLDPDLSVRLQAIQAAERLREHPARRILERALTHYLTHARDEDARPEAIHALAAIEGRPLPDWMVAGFTSKRAYDAARRPQARAGCLSLVIVSAFVGLRIFRQ